MILNQDTLQAIFLNFKTIFTGAFEGAESQAFKLAMRTDSRTKQEKYAWMANLPRMREWLGERVLKNVSTYDYTIKNRKFEDTISVPRDDIEDDTIGIYGPLVREMGRAAAEHPDELLFELIPKGFTELAYDGQFFFDTDHPVIDKDEVTVNSVSNMQAGASTPWYLFDTTRAIRPFVFQTRVPYSFAALTSEQDEHVFRRDEFLYGLRARVNVGFGLWQLAFASKADLTPANYRDARKAMMEFKGDFGRPLGVRPSTLVVPPSLEEKALQIINSGSRIETVGAGDSVALTNEWKDTAELIVTPWLA